MYSILIDANKEYCRFLLGVPAFVDECIYFITGILNIFLKLEIIYVSRVSRCMGPRERTYCFSVVLYSSTGVSNEIPELYGKASLLQGKPLCLQIELCGSRMSRESVLKF